MLLLIVVVTLHNVPEGLAVGISFGSAGTSEKVRVCTAIRSVRLAFIALFAAFAFCWSVREPAIWIATGEYPVGRRMPVNRDVVSVELSQRSCYQFPDPRRDGHLGWVMGRPQRELNSRPRD
uniref:Zinc transporter ZIP11 n=1 Tax=Plectus sambesii TaxID=2011161 RepID=A0A914V3L7_9BILA